jgi:alpha-galactosidase
MDFCYVPEPEASQPWLAYDAMHDAIIKTGRKMVFSICNDKVSKPWSGWGAKAGHMWRVTSDIQNEWSIILNNFDGAKNLSHYAGPGGWNDADMIEVGVTFGSFLSLAESKSHFSLWSILAAPLILGLDTSKTVDQWALDIIGNEEVIAVNQDHLGVGGVQWYNIYDGLSGNYSDPICTQPHCRRLEVWARPLRHRGEFAAVIFNRAGLNTTDTHFGPEKMKLSWHIMGLSHERKMRVRDLWSHKDLGVFHGSFETHEIAPHDSMMIKLTPHHW